MFVLFILQGNHEWLPKKIGEIDGFVLKLSTIGETNERPFAGRVLRYEEKNQTIVLKVEERLDDLIGLLGAHHLPSQLLFDIEFHEKRLLYQLQHLALKLIKEQKLFDLLINNPEYKLFCTSIDIF